MGPMRGAACDWYTARKRLRPPSTRHSNTMSALSRPDCGRAAGALSILIDNAGVVDALAAGRPVKGQK